MLMTKTIISNLLNKYATKLHPFEKREMPKAYRGRFNLDTDKCIMCSACALKCPTKCITVTPDSGTWHQDAMLCVHCNVCVESCPTKCLTMTNEYRSPYLERMSMDFQCKPRVKKKKSTAEGSEAPQAGATEAAPVAPKQ